jgi:hypothetical protein
LGGAKPNLNSALRSKPHLHETEKNGGDLRQTNQFDQRLWPEFNIAADASIYRQEGASCEAISIFLMSWLFDYLPRFFRSQARR